MISKYETHLRVAKHYCGVATAIGELFAKGGEEVVRSLALFDQERGQIDASTGSRGREEGAAEPTGGPARRVIRAPRP